MSSYNTLVHGNHGGATFTVESGGTIDILEGGKITDDGVQASAIESLTDSTGGTANDTLAAMPTLTDSPASADALRDDINTNMVPVINSNFADIGAKVNAILAALRGVGIIASA